jgi:ArsR family transcriptional regulator, cadmium/lead-responsive transcriptional repressor
MRRRGGYRPVADQPPTIIKVTQNANRPASRTPSGGTVVSARWFRVLADPTRLAIIQQLLSGECSVSELVTRTALPRSRVSNHLACLRWCQFVHAEQRGRHVVYSIADTRLRLLLDLADDLVADNAGHLATCQRIGPDWA